MRLILIGCEYVGKTTLANKITKWLKETTGGGRTFHDHFTIPPSELSADEQMEFLRMSPELQAMFQRYAQAYHLNAPFTAIPITCLLAFTSKRPFMHHCTTATTSHAIRTHLRGQSRSEF